MAFYRISIMLHCFHKFTMLNIHSFHPETLLLFLQLIVHDFLEAHALEAQQIDQAIIVALVCEDMVRVHAVVVDVELVENHITWRAHLQTEVNCDI